MTDYLNRSNRNTLKTREPPPKLKNVSGDTIDTTLTKQQTAPSTTKFHIGNNKTMKYTVRQTWTPLYVPSTFGNKATAAPLTKQGDSKSEDEVQGLFDQMLERRGITDTQLLDTMKTWPLEKKRLMIHQDTQAELLASHNQQSPSISIPLCSITPKFNNEHDFDYHHSSSFISLLAEKTNKMRSTLNKSDSRRWSIYQTNNLSPSLQHSRTCSIRSSFTPITIVLPSAPNLDNSPEFFIRKFMETNLRAVSVNDASNLEFNLRTRSITWLMKFLEFKGLHILISCLKSINHQMDRTDEKALTIELEIIKCIKALINTKLGGKETKSNPNFIHIIVFSLACPCWKTRKLVCEILAFVCYPNTDQNQEGHDHVMRGFEMMMLYTNGTKLFDIWLKTLISTLDGRGRMGSMVGAQGDWKRLGVKHSPEKHMIDYTVSNMLLINALIKIPKATDRRLFVQTQLDLSGMETHVLPRLHALDHNQLNDQVTIYQNATTTDRFMEGNTLGDDSSLYSYYSCITDPGELVNHIVNHAMTSPPELKGDLLGILKNLLLIKTHSATRVHYYHLLHVLINYIVTKSHQNTSDESIALLGSTSLDVLISHFTDWGEFHEPQHQIHGSRTETAQIILENIKLKMELQRMKKRCGCNKLDQLRWQSKTHGSKSINGYARAPHKESRTTSSIYKSADRTPSNSDQCQLFDPSVGEAPDQLPNILAVAQRVPSSFSPPPPPPPPPPGSSPKESNHATSLNTSSIKRKSMQYHSQTKLKHIQWQKLDIKDMDNTIWSFEGDGTSELETQLSQAGVFETLDAMFISKTNVVFERKMMAKANERMSAVKFLSDSKSRGLSVAVLPKFKHLESFGMVRQSILHIDDIFCTETLLKNLLLYAPSKEDNLQVMDKYLQEKECASLDLPERFTVEMKRMYRYDARLRFMLFRVQFWEKIDHLTESMTTIVNVSDSLRSSKSIRQLLDIILIMGNYMNGPSLQGGAFGFKITALTNLMDTKATDMASLTFLHVLAGIIRRRFPSVLQFTTDLKDVGCAARITASLNDTIQQYTDMRQTLKELDDELTTYWQPDSADQLDPNDRFALIMAEYHEVASLRFKNLEILYHTMDSKWKQVILLFGHDPKIMRPDEFFSVFAKFLNQWKVAAMEEQLYSDREEQQRSSKLRSEKHGVPARYKKSHNGTRWMHDDDDDDDGSDTYDDEESAGPETPDEQARHTVEDQKNNDRRMMDDLLDRLRNGENLHRTRRQRWAREGQLNNETSLISLHYSSRSSSMTCIPSPSESHDSIHEAPLSAEDILFTLQNEDD